jgi:hypothetical protein
MNCPSPKSIEILSKKLVVAEYKYGKRSKRSLEPVVGAIHELPLPQVSYLNSATPEIV